MGSPAIRRRNPVTWATLMRLRRSAISSAFATSSGQIAGVSTSVPTESKSRTPSVKSVRSSSKHQANATDASRTMRLIAPPFIDQLAYGYLSQSHTFSELANFLHKLAGILLVASIGENKLRN